MAGLLSGLMGGQGGGLLSDPMLRLQMGAQMMQGKSLGDQLGGAFGAAAQYGMQRKQLAEEKAKQNQTLDYLRQQDPELAQAVEAGVLDPASAYKAHLERSKPQQPDFMEVGGQLFDPATKQWIAPPPNPNNPNGGVERALNGIPMQDSQGNWYMGQLDSAGSLSPAKMPDGFTVASPYDKAASGAQGKAEGVIRASLPTAKKTAEETVALVDSLLDDPALAQSVGPIQGRLPSFREGSIRFDERVQQLQGRAFLEARQMLKGGGQITDYEGARAEAAMARMSQAKSEDDFKAALQEFKDAVSIGYQKLEAAYGGGMQQPMAAPAGAPSLDDLLKKY